MTKITSFGALTLNPLQKPYSCKPTIEHPNPSSSSFFDPLSSNLLQFFTNVSAMDEQFLSADKEALVDIVKISQRQAMRGSKGRWREFLRTRDRSLNVVKSIYDPAKRSVEDLIAFLQTFEEEEDLKVFARILLCHSNRKVIAQMAENSGEVESPQQKLVRLTLEHPEYPLNYSFPSHREDWMVTKLGNLSKAVKSNEMIAVDCEMVLCEDETEAVVKVCVVDQNLEVKLNELVNPYKAVSDYRTNITGISAEDLEGVTCSLEDIQKSMKKLLRHGTILIGHSLNSDLQALKLDHARVIDTSLVFTSLDGPSRRRSSLNDLCKSMLGHGIRKKDAVHNCMDDAQAVMKLVLSKIGGGSDKTKAKDRRNVLSEIPPATKLFLHDIPKSVPKGELRKIFPADITVKIETNGKVRAKKYSAVAIFTNPQEAHEAFESIKSSEGKDSFGRPQKLASLELSTGLPATLQVRKWEADSPRDSSVAPKKRSIEVEETTEESKRQKTDSQINPENNEVERLKQELQNKDKEIATLQKIVAALTRKQGL